MAWPRHIVISWFEAGLLSGLLVWANSGAITLGWTGLLVLLHLTGLVSILLLLRHTCSRLARGVGRTFFALTALVLVVEISIQELTGLHLNRFVLSLLAQPQATGQIGLGSLAPLVPLIITALLFGLSRLSPRTLTVKARPLILASVVVLLSAQTLFAILIHTRNPELLSKQRDLVFFQGLHHYHAAKLLTPLIGPRPSNTLSSPLSLPQKPVGDLAPWTIQQAKDILLVVIDSWRAKDFRESPATAPNWARWSEKGYHSLDHLSTSNCTHFSMHTLFTGDLPTDFGTRRERGYSDSIFHALQRSGFKASASEAISLDWYDLANTYMQGVTRSISDAESNGESDRFVIETALEILLAPGTEPRVHLAYLDGPHFSAGELTADMDPKAAYLRRVKETDQLIGEMLDSLDEAGRLDDMLIILTADHGEQLMENGFFGHAGELTDEQTIVPLLVLGAKEAPTWIRSHRDIAPFLQRELAGDMSPRSPAPVEILAGCDYAYPKSFAVIEGDRRTGFRRTDFSFERGLLSPKALSGAAQPTKKATKEAALLLLQEIAR